MRQIFDAAADHPVINALFIQPTYWCALNCQGCYVKEHQQAGGQMPVQELIELFSKFYHGVEAHCNQITVSMDVLPKEGKAREDMLMMAKGICFIATNPYPPEGKPEVHLTFNSVHSYREYNMAIGAAIDMITFSNIKGSDLEYIKMLKDVHPKLKINYNHMRPVKVSDWHKHIDFLKLVLHVSDSMYCVIHKSPIGKDRDLIDTVNDRKKMYEDLKYFKLIHADLQSDKVIIDGCIKDVVEYGKTGFGCSSSVSRFQVWPDGSVSGCAYAHQGSTPPATTSSGIIENIRSARKSYDFKKCYLPSTFKSLQQVQ